MVNRKPLKTKPKLQPQTRSFGLQVYIHIQYFHIAHCPKNRRPKLSHFRNAAGEWDCDFSDLSPSFDESSSATKPLGTKNPGESRSAIASAQVRGL